MRQSIDQTAPETANPNSGVGDTCLILKISRPILPALLLVVVAFALGGCAITIQQPANNATVTLPSQTKVLVTGNASFTDLKVKVDGVDVSGQVISTGASSAEGDLNLAAGPHTVSANADVFCWYCAGSKTQSTATNSFIVSPGFRTCARGSGPSVISLDPKLAEVGQQPGRQFIGYALRNGTDGLLIIVDDAPGLARTEMGVELDIDPSQVTWDKAIEAWDFCQAGSRVALVTASMMGGFGVGVICAPLSAANDFRSGCTTTGTMMLNQSTTSELWLRKPGVFGVWYDAEVIDQSIWQVFGGRSLRFIWKRD